MNIRAHTPASVLRLATLAAALPLLGGACDMPSGGDLDDVIELADEDRMGSMVSSRLQVLEDREAIRDVAACYGRGHDAIFTDLGGEKAEAFEILSTCFSPDVHTDVYIFDSPQPVAQLDGLDQLVGFIEQFALDTGYTGARNVVGDVQIELGEDGTALMVSATATPHFIGPADPAVVSGTVDLVTARYEDHLVRGEDGVWRTEVKVLRLDQFWRGQGSYPLAQ